MLCSWAKCECEERHFNFVFNSILRVFWQHLPFSEVKISSVQYVSGSLVRKVLTILFFIWTKVKYLSFFCPFSENSSVATTYYFGLAVQRAVLCPAPTEVLLLDFQPGPACLCKQLHLDLVIHIQCLCEGGCVCGHELWREREVSAELSYVLCCQSQQKQWLSQLLVL